MTALVGCLLCCYKGERRAELCIFKWQKELLRLCVSLRDKDFTASYMKRLNPPQIPVIYGLMSLVDILDLTPSFGLTYCCCSDYLAPQ